MFLSFLKRERESTVNVILQTFKTPNVPERFMTVSELTGRKNVKDAHE